ncbi:MAG: hypothetical protein M1832_005372 [Thelocarpon impressellum]|nr:MAG: hypothetical protein M1832_005372 [Thelocarpon impressellum]
MTRTLPWLAKGARRLSDGVEGGTARASKRRKTATSELDDGIKPSDASVAAPKAIARLSAARTPSTSPPPAPPEEEFIRDGMDADDKYIMVEDEFLATAKTFTQHLHHAEYIRLKNLARTRNSSAAKSIARPVDSLTDMRQDLKMQKLANAASTKQKAALQNLMDPMAVGALGQWELDEDDDREDDPWVGTSLQNLMTTPKRAQQSLAGIAGTRSGTRAAADFHKVPGQDKSASHLDLRAPPTARPTEPLQGADDMETEDEGDDDLDVPIRPKPRPANAAEKQSRGFVESRAIDKPDPHRRIHRDRPPSRAKRLSGSRGGSRRHVELQKLEGSIQ